MLRQSRAQRSERVHAGRWFVRHDLVQLADRPNMSHVAGGDEECETRMVATRQNRGRSSIAAFRMTHHPGRVAPIILKHGLVCEDQRLACSASWIRFRFVVAAFAWAYRMSGFMASGSIGPEGLAGRTTTLCISDGSCCSYALLATSTDLSRCSSALPKAGGAHCRHSLAARISQLPRGALLS